MINVVLLEPEIPNNTGNIVRTCAATGAVLHVIEPCGFSWEDKYLKRSGLDYWDISDVRRYKNIDEFLQKNFSYDGGGDMDKSVKEAYTAAGIQTLFSSTKGSIIHSDIKFEKDCYVFFRQGNARTSRTAFESKLRKHFPHSHARGSQVAQSVQFRGCGYL